MRQPEQIEVPVWWSNGSGMSYRRDCLPVDHPENTYHYMKNTMGLIPEQYGITNPALAKYDEWTREQLIDALDVAEKLINSAGI